MQRGGGKLALAVTVALIGVGGCSESDASPGFMPSSPAAADATELDIDGGACGATADVALDEQDNQIVLSVVWRGGSKDDCGGGATVALESPIGARDVVDKDAQRRWALVDGAWVSIGWCGVDGRCADDADIGS